MISASGLTVAFGDTTVVRDVSLSTLDGGVVGLIGPNGSGKTTVLRMLHGALRPRAGSVALDDVPLEDMSARDIARVLAVVVQEEQSDTSMTVGEMVLMGRLPHLPSFARTRDEDHLVAARALEQVGADHLGGRVFTSLSGGERQRVLIARAVAQQGTHLLLDEPTNHLDIRYQHDVLRLVRRLGTTTVVVLHDLNLAARYCDRLVLLEEGTVAASGTPREVLTPDLIRRVYGIGATPLEAEGSLQLLFAPLTEGAA
ncbi:ABC transporter ATP-binding protein [Brevibacterium yomogidense]|uniref:ABC transporter (Iron.B12.siderophore.hemin), ATP-binding component n=1 Tax=Brevibacterium yomogidense TaxID=946573 RepID=A0A1X6WUT4_9MICO|nr:ABC transporter ATP-binding protein [Brevibacterium yomogidense]SLM89075.1 ABC transporter (iron.B12.siderophore.hemin), ATP-binding component [Brevibacterium yomogidense]